MATIVIATHDSATRLTLEATLRERGHDVLVARDGADAVKLVSRALPELLILDAALPGVPGPRLARRLRSAPETAGVAILFLTEGQEPRMLPSFRAGADDYLAKPVDPPGVASRVEMLLDRGARRTSGSRAPGQGRLIAVAGPKGGCGRTTIAVNVALAIAAPRLEASVDHRAGATLLIDGHLGQGDVDVHLDLRSDRRVRDIVAAGGHLSGALMEEALVTHRSGLRVLIGARGSEESAAITPALWGELLQIAAALSATTVVDLGPEYEDDRTLATLVAAAQVLVVVSPEIGSVRNARQLLDDAPRLGLDRRRLQPVLNRSQEHAHLEPRAVAAALGVDQANLIVLPDGGPSTVGHINRGLPVVDNQRSALGRALEGLAHWLVPTPATSAPQPH